MTTIEQLLARAESTLALLQADTPDAPSLARSFGRDIYEIGRELTLHPEIAPQVRAFVERTAAIVRHCTALVFWFHRVADAAEAHSSETLEYAGALYLRSSLEFFRDLYRDTAADALVAQVETEETDESLREWGAEQYLVDIPAGIPASHVWWHQSQSGR
jgi:hypothetical protein